MFFIAQYRYFWLMLWIMLSYSCSMKAEPIDFGKVESVATYAIAKSSMSFKIEGIPTTGYSCDKVQSKINKENYVKLIIDSLNHYLKTTLKLKYPIFDSTNLHITRDDTSLNIALSKEAIEEQFNWFNQLSKVRVFDLANTNRFGFQFFNSDGSSSIEIGPHINEGVIEVSQVRDRDSLFHFFHPIGVKLSYSHDTGVQMTQTIAQGIVFTGEDYSNSKQVDESTRYFVNQGRMTSDMSPIRFQLSILTRIEKENISDDLKQKLDRFVKYETTLP